MASTSVVYAYAVVANSRNPAVIRGCATAPDVWTAPVLSHWDCPSGHDQAPHLDLIRLNTAYVVLASVYTACLVFRSHIRAFQDALRCFVQDALEHVDYVHQLPIHFTACALLARMHDEELQTALADNFGISVASQDSMRLPLDKLFTLCVCSSRFYDVSCKQVSFNCV